MQWSLQSLWQTTKQWGRLVLSWRLWGGGPRVRNIFRYFHGQEWTLMPSFPQSGWLNMLSYIFVAVVIIVSAVLTLRTTAGQNTDTQSVFIFISWQNYIIIINVTQSIICLNDITPLITQRAYCYRFRSYVDVSVCVYMHVSSENWTWSDHTQQQINTTPSFHL